ncbi:hypothetical protein [Ferrimonas balearica]|uniref:hypothetical protein n=1 Tax=Ferrimonas balearica TaxID=44012 RepID=UPI001C99F36D|nr:hypothetical protein [Ferrimonas balearica]MBY5991239.1 hypothetical protein [Ferrimonas balearica]
MRNIKSMMLLAAMGLLLSGCGSDNDNDPVTPEPPEPPVEESIGIDETTTLSLEITDFNGPSGAISFTLTGDDALPVTGANQFQVLFMGYPAPGPTSTKYGLSWHEAQDLDCTDPAGHCDAVLTEVDTGQYELLANGLSWRPEVEDYKAALMVMGANAANDPELIE